VYVPRASKLHSRLVVSTCDKALDQPELSATRDLDRARDREISLVGVRDERVGDVVLAGLCVCVCAETSDGPNQPTCDNAQRPRLSTNERPASLLGPLRGERVWAWLSFLFLGHAVPHKRAATSDMKKALDNAPVISTGSGGAATDDSRALQTHPKHLQSL